MIIINRFDLTTLLRYIRPRNLQIYQEAFIHRSAVKKIQKQCDTLFTKSNERLEFLGDSVLNVVTTNYLYHRFPHETEGFLTKLRIKIVKGTTLAWFAKKIGVQKFLVLSNSTVLNNNILENTFEALIGAIFLDYLNIGCEMYYVTKFLSTLFDEFIKWDEMLQDDNYKDILMRYLQKNHHTVPQYTIDSVLGQPHCPIYKVALSVEDGKFTSIKEATSKRQAEQDCAQDILLQMNVPLVSIS